MNFVFNGYFWMAGWMEGVSFLLYNQYMVYLYHKSIMSTFLHRFLTETLCSTPTHCCSLAHINGAHLEVIKSFC